VEVVAGSEYDEGRLMRNTQTTRSLLALLLAAALAAAAGADEDPAPDGPLAVALSFSPEYTTPVVDAGGEPVARIADLNGDGRADAAVLTVAVDLGVPTSAEALSDSLRLYAEQSFDPLFILEVHLAGQEAILTVELGRRTVWTELELVPLTDASAPLALAVGFRSRSASTTELVVFQHDHISRFTLENSRNERGLMTDVTSDGVVDIVIARRVPEAGRGYETFLGLHELRPEGFARTASLPVVRTVNAFLDATAAEMEREEWESLRERVAGSAANGLLGSAFRGVADEDEFAETRFDYPETGEDITTVVFPRLADNPFPSPYLGRAFRIVFRVECCEEPARFFEATVALDANPFEGSVLAFLTDDGGGK